jgi:hypothetical protein
VDTNVSEEHIASIFMAEVCRLRNRFDYVGTNQFLDLPIRMVIALKFSWAISRVNVELKADVSEISPV